jgi:hypothetical protein
MIVKFLMNWVMGGSLTSGFIAHDFYYFDKYIGINMASWVLLAALVWFHILVFMHQIHLAHVPTVKDKKRIERLRLAIMITSLVICTAEGVYNLANGSGNFSVRGVLATILSLAVIIFPEVVFKILFIFRIDQRKNDAA